MYQRKRNTHLLGGVILTLSIVVASTFCLATEFEKLVPGAACRPSDENADYSRSYSALYNYSSSSGLYAYCPIKRNDRSVSDHAFDRVEISIYDGSDDYYAFCYTYSCQEYGTSCDYDYELAGASASSIGTYLLTFTSGTHPVDDYYDGFYMVLCYLPKTDSGRISRVYSVYWDPE